MRKTTAWVHFHAPSGLKICLPCENGLPKIVQHPVSVTGIATGEFVFSHIAAHENVSVLSRTGG